MRATFVTLDLHGDLRGCIGSLKASLPLADDVAHNAFEAAFGDPRFRPLTPRGVRRPGHSHLGPEPDGEDDVQVGGGLPEAAAAGRGRHPPAGRLHARHVPAVGLGPTAEGGGLPEAPEDEGRPADELLVGLDDQAWRYTTEYFP